MCIGYLGFVLLVWFAAVLRAQSAAQHCAAPGLDGGFFAQKEETYSHGTKLTYSCNDGRKPAVKGWWATITCQNGTWSHEPQCIDEQACIPPTIPNAKYTESATGWYEDGRKIRITCDEAYDPRDVTTTCTNGAWSPLPVCERSIYACGEPPRIPHAVMIQEHQEVFAADSEMTYVCEDGYNAEGGVTNISIFCTAGNWTDGPTCKATCVLTPGEYIGGDLRLSASEYITEGETKVIPCVRRFYSAIGWCINGEVAFTSCRQIRPAPGQGGGSSGSDGRDRPPLTTRVQHCGTHPVVENGVLVENESMFLKYQCAVFYKLVGSDTVTCYNDGTWSPLPVCEEAFCVLTPGEYLGGHLIISSTENVAEGETKKIPCEKRFYNAMAQCRNGELTFTKCCHFYYPGSCLTAGGGRRR